MFYAMKCCSLLVLVLSVLMVQGQTDTNHRLNSPVWPSAYTIAITPYFDTGDARAFTFDGEVTIHLRTEQANVNQIKLHSEDLTYTSGNINLSRDTVPLTLAANNPLTFDTNYTFAYINLEAPLQVAAEHTLTISYTGPIRTDLNGFYRSSYTEQGNIKWLGATQMEPTHARKVFPCFDEPEYKANFTIIINRPTAYTTTLANTKRQSSVETSAGYVTDTFYPSPTMSTYLVAFLVSEFSGVESSVESRPLGVYSRPEAIGQSNYTLDIARRVVDDLSTYLNYDYYSTNEYLKLDHIAVPDFRAGAMENWGLVKYREGLLLYVPEESTPYYKYRVAQIVAHETAHMWFGDLVTCHWWSNIWLNEGFANYFENFIIDRIEPELGAGDILVTGSVHAALAADQTPSSPALTNDNVNSPAEISGHFGTVTYQKGGSVIRMIHNLIGDDAFRQGLNSYLYDNSFGMGLPSKMYESLERGVNYYYIFSDRFPGQSVTNVMSAWISRPGYPIVKVTVDHENNSINLEQTRFYINSSVPSSEELYPIPISYTTEADPNFENTTPSFIMDSRTYTLQNVSSIDEDNWVIFNIQETGFYRVNYDDNTWKSIARGLKGSTIHYLNKAKIVNDLFAFLNADVVQFELLYEVLEFLGQETEYSVWIPAISGFNSLRTKFMYDPSAVSTLDGYVLGLLEHVISELGHDVGANDEFVTLRNRAQILEHACKLGHQGCIDHAVAAFKQFKDNEIAISPSLRPVSYCNGLRYGDGSDFEFLWARMISTNVANEALIIQSALGCTRVEDKLRSFLDASLQEDSPIRWQDITVPLTSILQDHNNVQVALDFVRTNYAALSNVYPSMESVLAYFPPAMHSDNDFQEFESWLESCVECSPAAVNTAHSSLANAQATMTWAQSHHTSIIEALPGAASLNAPSLFGLMIALVVVLAMQF